MNQSQMIKTKVQKRVQPIKKCKSIIFGFLWMVVLLLGIFCFGDLSYASWIQEDDGLKYLQDNGQYAIGFVDIKNYRYYFDTDGHLVTGKFYVEENDAYYYSDESGVLQYGAIQTEDDFYITDENGMLLTGFAEHEGKRYYFNEIAQLVVGWFKCQEDWYYADSTGVIQTGFVDIDDYQYYFNDNGTRVKEGVMEIDGVTYIFNSDGSVDKNATSTYPIFQHINQLREQYGQDACLLNNKLQACALLRASDLVHGYSLEDKESLEKLLANRGVLCSGGYEFAYGGIPGYDFNRLISDMQNDINMLTVLSNPDVSEIGIGIHVEDDLSYYSIIFIKNGLVNE